MKKWLVMLGVAALVAFAAPAFAENPFMDVPMNHWAYDAISQLAADGIVSGYPDGSFKGNQPMTRYEMASIVARALAKVDMDKASKQDVEMLKKLVVEFKDELDALGVKVDKLDKRVAVLEENLGGWKFAGDFRFAASWTGNDNSIYSTDTKSSNKQAIGGKEDFTLERYRFNITKRVDDRVSLFLRVDNQDINGDLATVKRAYATIKFPSNIKLRVGKLDLNWESPFYTGDYMMFCENDAFETDLDFMNAFALDVPFAKGDFQTFVAHFEGSAYNMEDVSGDMYKYGARLSYTFSEKATLSANFISNKYRQSGGKKLDPKQNDTDTYWMDAIYNFTPSLALKGQYFWQEVDDTALSGSPRAWKAILDVKQNVLKVTALWVEYAKIDQNFRFAFYNPYYWTMVDRGTTWLQKNNVIGYTTLQDTNVWSVVAKQQWNDQWWTYIHYGKIDSDHGGRDLGYDDWTVSVRYNYTPALYFELLYDNVTYDDLSRNDVAKKNGIGNDHLIQLRTFVSF